MRPLRRLALACLVYSFGIGTSLAHAPIEGIGTFYNGLLHPVVVPSHLLLLIATGCLLGQFTPNSSSLGLPAFLVSLCMSLGLAAIATVAVPAWMLSANTVLTGTVVAVKRPVGRTGYVILALLAGALVGLTSTPDGEFAQAPGLALAGTALGGAAIVILFGGAAAVATLAWQRIAIRVLGSWIAASALMILSFEWTKIA